jgi:chemotaxis protein MotB
MRYPCKHIWLFAGLLSLLACVRPKVYRTELAARYAYEARSKTLEEELAARRSELDSLIRTNGLLNRTIGRQDEQIKALETDIATLTQQHGESAARLAAQKNALERELTAKNQRLTVLDSIGGVQELTKKTLTELQTTLQQTLAALPGSAEITTEFADRTLLLTVPDKLLFDANGLGINATGRQLLNPLAELLSKRPEIDVEIVAHTDNTLPKALKDLGDTWQWSLQRAINVVRLLIRDYNINPNQLTAVGRGEFYPLVSNETAEGRQKNRRIVFVFFPALPAIPAEP